MNSSFDTRSIPELLSDALAQLSKLFQNEVDLARAELSEKASKAAGAAKFIAAGGILLIPALVLVLFPFAASLIQIGLSGPLASLITGVGGILIAGALIGAGLSRLSGDALKPKVTIDQINRDKIAARELLR